jgi:hypothetical protein
MSAVSCAFIPGSCAVIVVNGKRNKNTMKMPVIFNFMGTNL